MAEPNYYYNKGGAPTGPISVVQLKDLATSGQIKPTDLVWREGTQNWVAAQTVKGLFSSVGPTVASSVPPAAPSGPPPLSGAPPAPPNKPGWSQSDDAKAAAEYARGAASKAREASAQAWVAVKTLFADPVGGIGQVYESLGEKGSMAAGAVFVTVCLVGSLLAGIIGGSWILFPIPVMATIVGSVGWFKGLIVGLILNSAGIATMIGLAYLFSMKTRSGGTLAGAVLMVGAALLPFGLAQPIVAILGSTWFALLIICSIFIFAIAFCVMLLFSGLTKITKMSERFATVAVPLMLVAATCAMALLHRALW